MVLYDVIVIGAGIVGSSAAFQLAKDGYKTLLIEQVRFLFILSSVAFGKKINIESM